MKDPAPLSEMLEKLVAGLGPENPMETAKLFGAWDQIVGPEVAGRCSPTSLKKGILKVRADSAAWASEFKYLAPEVVRRINQKLGPGVVTKIEPWVPAAGGKGARAPSGSTPKIQRAIVIGSPTSEELEEADSMTGSIADKRLAEATKRALLAGKMRKKGG